MGRQHAQQVGDLRVKIVEAMRQRLGRLERYGVDMQPYAFVVGTNHYRSPQMRDCWVDRYPPELRGNSHNRYARVDAALRSNRGRVDAAWAQLLMADHGGASPTSADRSHHAICRHSEVDTRSITISTALFLPRERMLLFANGQPCRAPFQAWRVV